MSLVKHGVPWDVAKNLSDAELIAYCVIAGEMDGGRFNWATLTWHKD